MPPTTISIHALLAESDDPAHRKAAIAAISIHALLAESDPAREKSSCMDTISIHALLAESDRVLVQLCQHPGDFYPRSPCGERH